MIQLEQVEKMKLSSIIATGIAVVGAKKPKFSKSDFQDAKDRGIFLEEEANIMHEKCGGKPQLPANAIGLDCAVWNEKGTDKSTGINSIGCDLVCPAGWRPDRKNWTVCRLNHPKENRRGKWNNPKLGSCIPLCPDMSEALKSLPSNVYVEQGVREAWRAWTFDMPNIKFACIDKRDQITIKGKFQYLLYFCEQKNWIM